MYPHGAGLADMQLTSMQRKVLTDLTQILGIPYCAQEILSSSHTPTLAMALPTYEDLISSWQEFQHKIPEMAVHIKTGTDFLEKYVRHARKTRIYALAMSQYFIKCYFCLLQ